VKEFLNEQLYSLAIGEDINSREEKPHIVMAMLLIGHKCMPAWDAFETPKCKA
jgi:hypothetical protein